MRLIFYENIFILLMGLVCGLLAAIIGILPSLLSPSFSIPGAFVIWMILGVFLSGLIWIWIPVRRIMKVQLILSLRNE